MFGQMKRQVEKQNITNMQFTNKTHSNVHKPKLPVTGQLFVTLLREYHLIGQISKSV
jgi:hypothetical protein